MSKLQIYKASAGSGKTHTLTREYLTLALREPERFNQILAVTFTKKATEEMKERIIAELAKMIDDPEQSGHYKDISAALPDLSATQLQAHAQGLLNHILHDYSFFAVNTIDSFVQRVVRAFAFELNLEMGYDIEMRQNKVINDLIDRLYKTLSTTPDVLEWLINFALYKISEGKSWDSRQDVVNLAQELFKESYQQFLFESESIDNHRERMLHLREELTKRKQTFEDHLKDISLQAHEVLEKANIKSDQLGNKFKTISNYLLNKISSPAKTDDYRPGTRIHEAMESFDGWHKKNEDERILDAIRSVFEPLYELLDEAIDYITKELSSYLTASNTLRFLHTLGLLNDIANKLPDYRQENNLLLISDSTLLLRHIVNQNDSPFVYEKVGNRYEHILIDEFQDTSGFQWDNFRPLVNNSLAEGHYNLIVGDVKQSIYRWRGGDWQLLLRQVERDIGEAFVQIKSLDTNWRSRENIIDFNNAIFHNIPTRLQQEFNKLLLDLPEEIGAALEQAGFKETLMTAYSDSYQYLPKHKDRSGGWVKVRFFESPRKEMRKKWRENIETYLPKAIEQLLEDGYRAGDIAILVRRNDDARQIVDLLLNYMEETPGAKHYQVVSPDALFIANAKSVRILLTAIRYLYDESDLLNLTTLVHQYQTTLHDSAADSHLIFAKAARGDVSDLPEEFLKKLPYLKKLSLYDLVEELIHCFALNKLQEEWPYMQAFQNEVLNFMRKESTNLPFFLDWWEREGKNKSVQLSEKQDAIRLLTIHKSKGLAFNVVIMPYTDWQFEPDAMIAPIIWAKHSELPYNQFPYLPLKYKSDLLRSDFFLDYIKEKLYLYMDALNMLYVSQTRAREGLLMLCPTDCKTDKIKSIADLIYQSIVLSTEDYSHKDRHYQALANYYDPQTLCYENNPGHERKSNKQQQTDAQKTASKLLQQNAPNRHLENMAIVHHANDFFKESIEYIKEKVDYGKLMHSILSKIYRLEDIPDLLHNMINTGQLTNEEAGFLEKRLEAIIGYGKVKSWFDTDWEVITERAILTSEGRIKIPDRVLTKGQRAVVIEFKFGKAEDEHKEQVAEYMALMKAMDYTPVEGFLYYPDEAKVIEIKPVGSLLKTAFDELKQTD